MFGTATGMKATTSQQPATVRLPATNQQTHPSAGMTARPELVWLCIWREPLHSMSQAGSHNCPTKTQVSTQTFSQRRRPRRVIYVLEQSRLSQHWKKHPSTQTQPPTTDNKSHNRKQLHTSTNLIAHKSQRHSRHTQTKPHTHTHTPGTRTAAAQRTGTQQHRVSCQTF